MVIIAKSETKESLLEHTENALKVFKSIKEFGFSTADV